MARLFLFTAVFSLASFDASRGEDVLTAAAAVKTGGLTRTFYENTALTGAGVQTNIISSLDKISTSGTGATGSPSALLVTGRLAPSTAGRYGFNLTFEPPLPYPSPDAYARLWVDDHLILPHNESNGGWSPGVGQTLGCEQAFKTVGN